MEPTHLPPIVEKTEDDTFRILARPDFSKIREMYFGSNFQGTGRCLERIAFMKEYGWTWREFTQECDRRGMSNCR